MESSRVLRTMVDPTSHFKEAKMTAIDLLEDDPTAMKFWFQLVHTGTAGKDVDLTSIWEILAIAHKYELDPKSEHAKTWFQGWWAIRRLRAFDFEDYQALLFPCHTFDYAPGFACVTKYLANNATGHITEKRPTGIRYDHLRLENQVIRKWT
jgi:hypothetical protein